MTIKSAVLLAVLFVAAPAGAADVSSDWEMRLDAGGTTAAGTVRDAFGGGVLGRATVSRRLAPRVWINGSLALANFDYRAGQLVDTTVCSTSRPPRSCHSVTQLQHGESVGASAGWAVRLNTDARGRVVTAGAGVLHESYSISHAGADIGPRRGWGAYAELAGDLWRIGPDGGVGLGLRASHVSTRGESFGTSIPNRTGDTWLDATIRFRIGGQRTGSHE